MNINLGFSQRKFGFGPNMRTYSTMGILPAKYDNLLPKNAPLVPLSLVNFPIISDKTFTNPNFVNKNNPNILAPIVASTVKIDKKNYCVQDNICDTKSIKHEPETIVTDKIPEESSQKEIEMEFVNKMQEPNIVPDQAKSNLKRSPKLNKRNKRKKKRKGKKKNTPDKTKKNKKCSNKKYKPWHKTKPDVEPFESESTLDSDSSNMIEEPEPFCITFTPTSTPIDITNNRLHLDSIRTDSPMSVSPCHHELLKSLSVLSLSKSDSMSPCSPRVRQLRMLSECDSEDSFIVFDDKSYESEEMSSDGEDSDFDEESEVDWDCDIEFVENCDTSIKPKRVSFKNDSELCEIHPMIKWGYAYHTARVGPWEQFARDRARFEARIRNNEETLSKILCPTHRERIYKTRFENVDH